MVRLVGEPLSLLPDLTDAVVSRAQIRPDDVAVMDEDTDITWLELDTRVEVWRGDLVSLGLGPGDRVATLMPNRADLLVHYLACLRAAMIAVPLNDRYTSSQIEHALSVSGAATLIVHRDRADQVDDLETAADVVFYDDRGGLTSAGRGSAVRLANEDDEARFIFFTSGSTGPSKGVTHTRTSMNAMGSSAAQAFEITSEDVVLPGSSLSHVGAILWSFMALLVGCPVVIAREFDGGAVLPLLRSRRPTVVSMIPAALTALVRDHDIQPEDFSSIRVCRSGSDHVPAELEAEFIALTGFPIDEGYGMTEVGLAALNPPSGEIREGSVGTANPGYEISLRDSNGDEVATGDVGEIWMRSPAATVGYWNNSDATAALFEDGWIKSGDEARADEDGYLWFFGRSKQIIVHDGSHISPTEVEDALSRHPSVESTGVVGVYDSVHGENVRAYVVVRDGSGVSGRELILYAREQVGSRAPDEVLFLEELPLNPTGKIDRNLLRQLAEEHRNPNRRSMTA